MLTDEQKRLVEANIKLIQWVATRWRNPMLEPDDIFQIAAIGFCKAAEQYRPEIGRFSTMAVTYAQRELLSAAGRRKKCKVYSLETPIRCEHGKLTLGGTLRDGTNLDDEITAGQIDEVIKESPPTTRRILELMACGCKQYEVAGLLGMSRQNVQQTIKRVKPKLDQITGCF